MKPAWRFAPTPVVSDTYDTVHIAAVHLRFPVDGASGGECWVQRMLRGQPVGEAQHVALEPGEPDALPQALVDWLLACCQKRGLAPSGAVETDVTATKAPTPVVEPGIRLG